MFNSYRRLPPMLRAQVVWEEKKQLLYNVMWYKMHQLLKGFGGIRAQWDKVLERGSPRRSRRMCESLFTLSFPDDVLLIERGRVSKTRKIPRLKQEWAFGWKSEQMIQYQWNINCNKIHLKDNCGNLTSDVNVSFCIFFQHAWIHHFLLHNWILMAVNDISRSNIFHELLYTCNCAL